MIYVVEDDNAIRELVLYTLRASNLEGEGYCQGEELFSALERQKPSLILLDIMLPGMDGIEILKRLRSDSATAHIPVILASAKGSEYDKVLGLDLGADDYLAKPFGMMEMVSRIRAVLRRTPAQQRRKPLELGRVKMDLDAHCVYTGGVKTELTRKEYELLRLFLQEPGRVFSRDQLLQRVWGMDYMGESRTVDVHVGTLRMKLGESGDYIQTVRGVGYRMEERP